MECMKQHCIIIHTYIYQAGPFKFRLLVRTLHNFLSIFVVGANISTSWWVIHELIHCILDQKLLSKGRSFQPQK